MSCFVRPTVKKHLTIKTKKSIKFSHLTIRNILEQSFQLLINSLSKLLKIYIYFFFIIMALINSFICSSRQAHCGELRALSEYVHQTEAFDLGLHQQPETMTTRHAGAVESADGACSRGLCSIGLSQERE